MNVPQESFALTPLPEAIAEALGVIRPRGAILLVAINPNTRDIRAHSFIMPDDLADAVTWAVQINLAGYGVYFTTNIAHFLHRKANKDDMVQAVAFWADCDPNIFKHKNYQAARDDLLLNLVPRLKKYATFIIDSGNGIDPFFVLEQPITIEGDFDGYESLNKQLGEVCGGPGTFNCDRVMRLPGTLNYPNNTKLTKGYPQEPSLAKLIYVSDKKYTLAGLKQVIETMDLHNRFVRACESNLAMTARYAGDTNGLNDTSGSAMDFSMVSMLKTEGFTLDECIKLLSNWPHGSSSKQRAELRYWQRCWERTTPKPPVPLVDFSALRKDVDAPQPVKIKVKQSSPIIEIDNSLYQPPGIMGNIANWINATASKPQPQFAVQIALACVATLAGRRFKTDCNNWPSLYLMNIGPSACGKEYGKSALEQILEACGCANLIGPSAYTSNSGLLSVLHAQPNHVTVIDEFHRLLELASIKTNERVKSMLTALMEVWGRNDGTLRPQGYSTFGATGKEAQKMQERSIRNPALTLVALGIPQFFETVGSAAVKDGFLNRFLIVETNIGRQAGNFAQAQPVPESIVDWAKETRARYTGIVDPDVNPSMAVNPVIVPFAPEARRAFEAFAAENIERMNEYDKKGVAEMFGRTNEMGMKIALICAIARSASEVSIEDAQWAINYTRTYSMLAAERLASCVSDSEFESAKKQVLDLLIKHGEKGMTVSQIDNASKRFTRLTHRQQQELLDSLAYVGKAKFLQIPLKLGRYKTRDVWIAIEDEDSD